MNGDGLELDVVHTLVAITNAFQRQHAPKRAHAVEIARACYWLGLAAVTLERTGERFVLAVAIDDDARAELQGVSPP